MLMRIDDLEKDLVSIITPTYNSELFISDTIESIINQSHQNWELIITDDGSKDKTIEIIKNFAKNDPRIKVFKLEKNSGAAKARNNSIKKSEGKFLAFLDSDDIWSPEKLEMQLSFLKKNPDCPLIYSAYDVINATGEKISTQSVPKMVTYEDTLKSCAIGCLTAMINLEVTGKEYMPDLKRRQDYALWLKILRKYGPAKGTDKVLASYRTGNKSISSNKLKVLKYQWYTYYKVEGLGLVKSIYYMINWAYYGFSKHYL